MKTENQWNILRWRLEELSDKEFQEKLWLGKVDGQMSSFSECICGVFDDSGLSLALDRNSPIDGFTSEMKLQAEKLNALIVKLPITDNDIDVITNPKMREVRLVAAKLLSLLLP